MKTLAILSVLALGAAAVQDMPEPVKPLEEHEWLQQLVGEWNVTAETTVAPGAEPMRMESTERVRSIGGLWIQAEGSAEFEGQPFTSILTLGYDPAKRAFLGTWIDTMQTHMYVYKGSLDEGKKVLTLETEGPSFDDPSKMAVYHDVIELKSKDHRTLSSSVRGEDGAWTTFMRAEYRRK